MSKALYYEDVGVSTELPVLVKHPTTRQLVKWAGAVDDYAELHYDPVFAREAGLPGVVVHGWLITSFLAQLITNWMGDEGLLKKLTSRYKGIHLPGKDLICKGNVAKKYVENDQHYVYCEMRAENLGGETIVSSTALVILPSKQSKGGK